MSQGVIDPILTLNWLQATYKSLVGMSFQGSYEGQFSMPQTGNIRDVIAVASLDSLNTILSSLSKAVLGQTFGRLVWKGITGPEDNISFLQHWLWVEPAFSLVLSRGSACNFRIDHCEPFQCSGGTFSHGVSIKVSLA